MSDNQPQMIISSQELRNQQRVAAMQEAAENPRDQTVKGGRYALPGNEKVFVNANGEVISGDAEAAAGAAESSGSRAPADEPNDNWRNDDIRALLDEEGIAYEPDATKAELLAVYRAAR